MEIIQDELRPMDLLPYKEGLARYREWFREAVDAALSGNAELRPISYRARKADGPYVILSTRGFVLTDSNGEPEYFGGIIVQK